MNNVEDIEIYVKDLSLEIIQKWLKAHFDDVEVLSTGKNVNDFLLHSNDGATPVMIVTNAVGKAWTSIWFKANKTPWEDDMACARSLNNFGKCRVRANAAPWSDGEDMDEWWQMTETGEESTVSWPNAL
ncbi:hypothetical protein [Endozoicomonas arenosclerae]|uniref:hypothetical protein n=1 Tax=Endozoicomonas arenosclerae TaxID=1633495 RepID=UPI000782E4D5|nr:hypothetical protein [Endozoicomonas arenosclerae]